MSLPVVAIVGRPNVGKSALFNALVRSRVAIVDPMAGVTRDRVSTVLRAEGRRCELYDTGGIGIVDSAGLEAEIEHQIAVALHEADLLLFVVDVRAGLQPLDEEVAARLRRLDKPVLVVANKADAPSLDVEAAVFHRLGFGDPLPVSASERREIGTLREQIAERLPEPADEEAEEGIKIAVIGRTNAGKSTLVNRLTGRDRMIVSEVPGTTRDAVDLPFESDGRRFVAVDTAGMRKRSSVSGSPDFYGQARTERAIRRCQVALLLLDATQEIGRIERTLGQLLVAAWKPFVLVLTKWDLVEGRTLAEYGVWLADRLPFLSFAPLTCMSAQDDFHVRQTLALAAELHEQSGSRLSTGEINRTLKMAMEKKGPPSRGGRTGKVFFASQIAVHPPTIVLFVNDRRLLPDPYLRYLINAFREAGSFSEVPIKLLLRARDRPPRRR